VRVSATAKYLRGSTRKARLITQVIKGKPVEEAAALLRFIEAGRELQAMLQQIERSLSSSTDTSALNAHRLLLQVINRISGGLL